MSPPTLDPFTRPAPGAGRGRSPSAPESPDAGGPTRELRVETPGVVPYASGLRLQEELVAAVRAGAAPDTLVLLEHPHVITLGSGASHGHVLLDAGERARRGIELFETGRGGDVTYHGPGQLVGYPIMDLKPDRKDLHRYLRDLEEALIRALAELGVEGHREAGRTGVWTAGGKIAAIGVRVSSGWITSHGFALNVDPDLRFFDTIVPCGIAEASVTSLARLTGRAPDAATVRAVVARAVAETFGRRLRRLPSGGRTVARGG
jgi:lipoyl(octanoyl) transferase